MDVTNLDIFFGEATDTQARIYVECTADTPADATPSGTVTGPFCQYARTLPARLPLVACPASQASALLLSQAIVPDPCFWTPEMPFLYKVDVELRRGGRVLASEQRQFGIRPLGVRGCDLVLDGRRWVLRGADICDVDNNGIVGHGSDSLEQLLQGCHEARVALLVTDPTDAICELASQIGVLLMARIEGSAEQTLASLRRLARWAAVGIAILPEALAAVDRRSARNLLLGQHIVGCVLAPLPPWVNVALVEVPRTDELQEGDLRHAFEVLGNVPTVVCRSLPTTVPIAAARAACDRLQRDLVTLGDFAGYIV